MYTQPRRHVLGLLIAVAVSAACAAPAAAPTTAPPAPTRPATSQPQLRPAAAQPTAPAATTAAALTGSAKVGFVLSMTGAGAVYGATQKNGAQLAMDEINASGQLGQAKLEGVFEDDASDKAQGINAFQKLINQDKVLGIVGPTLSNTAQAADPLAQQAGVPCWECPIPPAASPSLATTSTATA